MTGHAPHDAVLQGLTHHGFTCSILHRSVG